MTDLPAGWTIAHLSELVEVLDNRRVPVSAKERAERPGSVPYYGATGKVGSIDAALFDDDLVLLGEDGVQFFDPFRPKAYVISGPAWVNNHVHVLRPGEAVDLVYLQHYLNHFDYNGYASGTTRLKLTKTAMNGIPVLLPPLAEQRRVVSVLDGHFSQLVAASQALKLVKRRLGILAKRAIVEAVPLDAENSWKMVTVGEAGTVGLGRQRHPDWHHGPNMRPYLRVANVFEDRIDTSDVMQMDFSPDIFERFRLQEGDILLNEGQSPELLGRPAMYRGVPEDVAFTNSLIRFQAGPEVTPEWALLVFRRHLHAGRFSREVRITTNIAHLSSSRFKAVEFPIPPLSEQKKIVARVAERIAGIERLAASVERAERQAVALRKSLLVEAFAGRLVPQDPNDEPASELLARTRSERAASIPKQRTRSRRNSKDLPAPPTRVTGGDYEQETLPL